MTNQTRDYRPDIAIHPGETLIENLEAMGMSQVELSLRTGLTEKTISEIVNGKNPISPSSALKLESALGISAQFWNNLQKNYDETVARLEREAQMQEECEYAKKFTCYSELAEFGLVEPHSLSLINERAQNLLRFFAIDSFKYLPSIQRVAFRKHPTKSFSQENLAAWLRWGEIRAEKAVIKEFNPQRIRESIPSLRKLTLKPVDGDLLRKICAECGIAVVFTPCLKNTSVNGATRWKSGKAIIQLSNRQKKADVFWFTFFHELGHILKHGKKEEFIEMSDGATTDFEREADEFAKTTLIPSSNYKQLEESGDFSMARIASFAESIGISMEIVAGRLAKDNHLPWAKIQALRTTIEIRMSK